MNITPTLDEVLVAISDPTRRAILKRLARGPARVTDAAAPFEMTLAAVSKHVRVLERAGMVRRARRGREHTLTLDARPLRQVVRWTSQYERFWNERLNRLETFFAEIRTKPMKTFDFTVSRTIHGPADEVFDVWLDPRSPGGLWFGVERAIINPVVDGLFYHVVTHEGRSWPHYGRFIRLDRGRAIGHTWVSEATRGLETVVTITLTPRGGDTEVTLHHANVPDDEMGRGHKEGWTWYLDELAERFEKVAAR